MQNDSVNIRAVNSPGFEVTMDNWHEPVDAFRKRMDDPAFPAVSVLQMYNLCPIPLFSELSMETWKLYKAIGGIGKVNSPQEYYQAQALYVDGVNIIENTMAALEPYLKELS